MESAILPGDRIIAQTFPVPAPKRGEIILFVSPQNRKVILAKRVIAVPGDRIRMTQDVPVVNGSALNEPYITRTAGEESSYPDDLLIEPSFEGCSEGHQEFTQNAHNGDVYVPPGGYFVLGDDRDNSLDSRCWGFVKSRDVIGRPLFIYDSFVPVPNDPPGSTPAWFGRRRWARLLKVF